MADLKPGNLLVKPGAPGPAVYLCDVEAVMALPKVGAGSLLQLCTALTAVPLLRCVALKTTIPSVEKRVSYKAESRA